MEETRAHGAKEGNAVESQVSFRCRAGEGLVSYCLAIGAFDRAPMVRCPIADLSRNRASGTQMNSAYFSAKLAIACCL